MILHRGVFAAAACFAVAAVPASARTWYVTADGTGDAPTIQAAIDSATGGDVLLVAPGTYDDTTHVQIGDSLEVVNVHLYKNVKLLAEGDPSNTTIGWSESDVEIYVSGVDSTAEIRGFRISVRFDPYFCLDGALAPAEPDFWFAIKCESAAPRIHENEFVDNGICINLRQSPAIIENNSYLRGFAGIRCYDGSHARIRNNDFEHCVTFVFCEHSNPEVVGNDITNGCKVVVCGIGGSAHIARNLITGMRTRATRSARPPP